MVLIHCLMTGVKAFFVLIGFGLTALAALFLICVIAALFVGGDDKDEEDENDE